MAELDLWIPGQLVDEGPAVGWLWLNDAVIPEVFNIGYWGVAMQLHDEE